MPSSSSTVNAENVRVGRDDVADDALEGERKTVTALFADIKGSTELEQDLDPEEARAIIDPALKLMIDAVRRYDGYVVQSTGDGIFAIFGAPVAHEDHPQRALYAALRMHDEIRRYADKLRADGRSPLQIRIGADTGEVVVRTIETGGKTEYAPIGHAANLASRMQSLANPGSTVISESTRKLVGGYFTLEPLGPTRIKGVSESVNVFEVTGIGPLRSRLQRSAARGYTKFVGREREMEALAHAAEQAKAGRGQIVAAIAEAGIGKSRLFYEFKVRNQSDWMVLEALSVSHGKASAYFPVIDLLHAYFKVTAQDDQRARRAKVTGNVLTLDRALEDTLPFLFALLSSADREDPLAEMDPQSRKRRTLEALKRLVLRESVNQPLMVIFEDLHWIDEETQAFLNLLADSIGTARILLLVNYRPAEYTHLWGNKTYYTQLRLDPLGKESADEMLASLLGSDVTVAPLKRLIAEKTQGNPLFMEEIYLSLLEDGAIARNGSVKLTRPLASLRIPATVQGILASRVDRLPGDEKELLQTVAVLGMDFQLGAARALSRKADDELNRLLTDLQLAEFIYEQPGVGDIEYTFKHALTQEIAYNSLLLERRKLLHERAGEVIEELFAQRLDDHLSELARHYSRSSNTVKAVQYLHLAGQQAAGRSAYAEAVGHFTSGLELLKNLPDNPERLRRELDLQVALAESLRWTQSLTSEETERALIRARELCAQVGENTELFAVLHLLQWRLNLRRADPNTARDLGEQLLTMAEEINDPTKLMIAHGALGFELFLSGEFATALNHLGQAGPGLDWSRIPLFVFVPCFGAWALWALGYPDQALKWSRDALAAAEALRRPELLANALVLNAYLHMFMRDPRMAGQCAEAAIATATEHGISSFDIANGSFVRGWALAHEGHLEEGVAEMRRAKADLEAQGIARPRWFASLAEACAKIEGPSAGLKVLAEGLALVQVGGERMYEAELHRVKGDLLLMQGAENAAEAERFFRTGIEVARRQGGKALELRATVSLARQLARTGRRDEARAMLAGIYGCFTEGFDTVDLRDAKRLLEEMNS